MSLQKPISIFIVDDENLARERLKRLIETITDYSVVGEAENGKIAINIVPEDWRLEEDPLLLDAEDKKKRVILRVGVTVSFEGISTSEQHEVSVSTLIRLIELDEDDDSSST